jgi:hypothetical protein
MIKLLIVVLFAGFSLSAQVPIQPNLDGFKYPALARSARIQGIVEFLVKPDGIQSVSGHPMLVQAARDNLEKWAIPVAVDARLSVTYSFRLTEIRPPIVEAQEQIGNGFDRFFLRLFHRPVTRKNRREVCDPKDSTDVKDENVDGIHTIKIGVDTIVPACVSVERDPAGHPL